MRTQEQQQQQETVYAFASARSARLYGLPALDVRCVALLPRILATSRRSHPTSFAMTVFGVPTFRWR
jgi:hypothetical protein